MTFPKKARYRFIHSDDKKLSTIREIDIFLGLKMDIFYRVRDYFRVTETLPDGYNQESFYILACVDKNSVNLINVETGTRLFFKPLVVNDLHKINRINIYEYMDTEDRQLTLEQITIQHLLFSLSKKHT
jgi:hypothetical protein